MSSVTTIPASMLQSSIWREDPAVCKVWMTMLMLKDEKGIVEASVGGLADASRVSVEDAQRALQSFLAPDPDSKSKNDEGRRIREVPRGWLVINHEQYAGLKDEAGAFARAKVKTRERQQRHREKKSAGGGEPVTNVTLRHACNVTTVTSKPPATEETAQPSLFPTDQAPAATVVAKAEKARAKRLPTTEPAKRMAALFRRRLTTPWSQEEIDTFRKLGEIDPGDLDVIEAYYARERAKGDDRESGGHHRRDLKTFLNNFTTELDRARLSVPAKNGHPSDVDPAGWREFLTGLKQPYQQYRYAPGFLKTQFSKR